MIDADIISVVGVDKIIEQLRLIIIALGFIAGILLFKR